MHVAIVSRIYMPESSAASLRLESLAKEIVAAGHKVSVLTVKTRDAQADKRFDDNAPYRVRRFPVLRDASGYVRGYLQYLSFDVPLFFRLASLLVSRAERPDVLLVEAPPTTAVVTRVASGIFRATKKVPYVYYAADVWSKAVTTMGAATWVTRVMKFIESRAWRGAQAVVSVSEEVSLLVSEIAPMTEVVTVGHGVNEAFFGSVMPLTSAEQAKPVGQVESAGVAKPAEPTAPTGSAGPTEAVGQANLVESLSLVGQTEPVEQTGSAAPVEPVESVELAVPKAENCVLAGSGHNDGFPQSPFLLYSGTASHIHGAEIFVEAFAQVAAKYPEVCLHFRGNGTKWESLKKLARSIGLAERVSFAPPVGVEEIAQIYRHAVGALASVDPSSGYGFAMPTKMLAAWACGTPTIYAGNADFTNLTSSLTTRVGAGQNLVTYCAYDVEAVAAAMDKLLGNPPDIKLRSELSEWASSNVSARVVAKRVVNVIERLPKAHRK